MATNNAVNVPLSGSTGTVHFVGSTSPTLTTPIILTSIKDTNTNIWLGITATASAVNYVNVANSATATAPVISALGSDTNILLQLQGKGNSGVGIQGTTAAGNAVSGYVGELVTSTITYASPVTITSTVTAQNVTSISLSAGDWDITGIVGLENNSVAMSPAAAYASLTTAGALPNKELLNIIAPSTVAGISTLSLNIPPLRVNVSGSQTVYLCAYVGYTGGTEIAWGTIYARRVR